MGTGKLQRRPSRFSNQAATQSEIAHESIVFCVAQFLARYSDHCFYWHPLELLFSVFAYLPLKSCVQNETDLQTASSFCLLFYRVLTL